MSPIRYSLLLRLTWPEIAIALSGLAILALDLTVLRRSSAALRFRAGIALAAIGSAAAIFLLSATPTGALPGGMFVVTPLVHLVQDVLIVLAMFTLLLSATSEFTSHIGEYLALILFATVAMLFLVAAQNLLIIFVALEFLSLSLYVLTGFNKRSRQSAEAALKYFLFGGMSAGFLLFGMSLLYGLSGSIQLPRIADALADAPGHDPLLWIAIVMVAIGFGFKIAAAPFHLWAPDAYQGAPTVSAGFLASSSKVASFFIFAQVVGVGLATAAGSGAFRNGEPGWVPTLILIAAISMVVGNLAALAQTSLRRLLAYSAIGHAGYMLLGIVAHSPRGLSALLYYVITYAVAVLGAFGVLGALEPAGVDRIQDLAGLHRRAPGIAFCLLIFILSLAGIPPLSGFFAKFYVFTAALESEPHLGLFWLVLLAVAMSAVSLYYYLRVLKAAYVAPAPDPASPDALPPLRIAPAVRATLWVLAALVVILGCAPNLLLSAIGIR